MEDFIKRMISANDDIATEEKLNPLSILIFATDDDCLRFYKQLKSDLIRNRKTIASGQTVINALSNSHTKFTYRLGYSINNLNNYTISIDELEKNGYINSYINTNKKRVYFIDFIKGGLQ